MLSPKKAADRVGVSRQTIMNAIGSKKLKAKRNNRSHWIIDPQDLEAWSEAREPVGATLGTAINTDTGTANLQHESIEIARLEERLRASEEKVSDLTRHLERRDVDYREAMELLREAQRPLWSKLRDAFKRD